MKNKQDFNFEHGVSIIVCCYNSEKRIVKTLEHLANQIISDPVKCEVILVDNASQDNTIMAAKTTWEGLPTKNIDFEIVIENQIGLSFARAKGMKHARYKYVLFCDDDNWLNHNYVINAYDFLSKNPDYAIVGGNGVPLCEIEPPKWFDAFKSMYATGCRKDGDVTNVYGAGMCLKIELLKDFSSLLEDRRGNSLSSGGDSEICHYLRDKGYKIRQLCSNEFKHFIPKERLNEAYLYRLARGRGYSMAKLKLVRNNDRGNLVWSLYFLRRHLQKIITALVRFDKTKFIFNYCYFKGYWFDARKK